MFRRLKIKIAARRIAKARKRAKTAGKPTFWAKVSNIMSRPFRMFAARMGRVWSWIRSIDLIGLVNLTLLLAIIVLFSILIINIIGCGRKTIVLVADEPIPVTIVDTNANAEPRNPAKVITKPKPSSGTITLPLKKAAKACRPSVAAKPAKRVAKTFVINGNLFIDGEFPGEVRLSRGAKIRGNLYLQNMRRYTLPCDMVIEGDLFLRNIGMLKFCGAFTVKGNIYVSRNSSFGPIPATARVAGQVIL
ncbi:MAG: polymer-forming cytoskeletal protein [Rickettsiales bacterium]|jgi:hypothetical protein|nr:polymer-forming cytoskeletal protein [Rickettsiales bacterium]